MYSDTIETFSKLAQDKANRVKNYLFSFLVSSAMAGAFIGIGIILIFSVGTDLDASFQKLVMGASFGIALTLVVFAGSELFTGHTMYMCLGWLKNVVGCRDIITVWTTSWVGNLIGSVFLACLFIAGGGAEQIGGTDSLLQKIAAYKMNSTAIELISRGILCNFLVCLALWMSARVDSDIAKCVVIFWCLFAFIASGYEHSVANMTLLSIALLTEHGPLVSIFGFMHNLLWVTIGNIIGGTVFVAFAYWAANENSLLKNNKKKNLENIEKNTKTTSNL